MTKTEFLEYLEKRLQVLNKKERDDILNEYAQHIELKMQSGLSEEGAIHDFGGLEELAAEILDAYNVNPEYQKRTIHFNKGKITREAAKVANKVEYLLKQWMAVGKKILHSRSTGNYFVLKCVLVVLILLVVYFPLLIVDLLIGNALYDMLPYPLDRLAAGGVLLGFHLLYLFIAFKVLYTYIKNNREGEPKEEEEWSPSKGRSFDLRTKVKAFFTLPDFPGKGNTRIAQKTGPFMAHLWYLIKSTVLLFIKGLVICFLTPVLLLLLFLVILFGNLIALAVLGYPVIGLTILLSGGLISGFTFIWFMFSLLWTKKERKEP